MRGWFPKSLAVLGAVLFGTVSVAAQDIPTYRAELRAYLDKHKRYPPGAKKARTAGVATVSFAIDGKGRVTHVSIRSSSGSAILDRETIAMVRRASPLPPPPDGKPKRINIPVRYRYP